MVVYSIHLWLQGIGEVIKSLWYKDHAPTGQIGGLLSSLLETLPEGQAAQWLEGKRVLDCGCGRGKLIDLLSPDVCYTGVDRDPTLVSYLQ